MKKLISVTALAFLLACFMTGCGMAKSGGNAVEQGARQVEEGASDLVNDGKAMLNEGKDMLQGDGMNNNRSAHTN